MTNRRHLIQSTWALFGLSLGNVVPACGATTVPNSSFSKIDTGFLKEEPWAKQKLSVDLSAITDPQHMQVIRGAINQIIVFIARLSTLPPEIGRAHV